MRSPFLLALLVAAGAISSCGEERIELTDILGTAEAGAECSTSPTTTCAPEGTPCTVAASCCSNRCEGGYCLQSGACNAPGIPCIGRLECCSGRCESSGSNLICTGYCRPNGSHCDTPRDCCTLACSGGTCGGPICKVVATPCGSDDECCSRSCSNAQCALDSSTVCRGSGEGCPGSDAGVPCCSGVCNQNRCDLGPGRCREPGTLCTVDADCCRGHCSPGPSGVSQCTARCLQDGADCNSAGDCCSGQCSGSPARCGASASSCSG